MNKGRRRFVRRAFLSLFVMAATAMLVLALASATHPPDTRSFRLDGRRYGISDSVVDDAEYVRREVVRRGGIPAPEDLDLADGGGLRDFSLSDLGPSPADIACPPGFSVEHSMKLEGERGGMNLAVGRLATRGRTIGDVLSDGGWQRRGHGGGAPGPRVYVKPHDKENAIVFVDESQGDFLILRRDGK